jgi:hypothetical protein
MAKGHPAVAARPSPIHGTGLFALRRIGVGEHLTHYDGEWISREKAVALDAEGEGGWLCTTGSRDVVIDGLRHPLPGRGLASFANHAARPNAALRRRDDVVSLVCTRPTEKGQEVTIHYGNGFWTRMRRNQQPTAPEVHATRIRGKKAPTVEGKPSWARHGARVESAPCLGVWCRAELQGGRLRYVDTDDYERATLSKGVLMVRSGRGEQQVSWRRVRGQPHRVVEVLWDEPEPVALGKGYRCSGPCAVRGARYVYVYGEGVLPVLVHMRSGESVTLRPGACFLVPQLRASHHHTGEVFGGVVRARDAGHTF